MSAAPDPAARAAPAAARIAPAATRMALGALLATALALALAIAAHGASGAGAAAQDPTRATVPEPGAALVELGRLLFADPLLSQDRSLACASCHRPERGFTDGEPTSRGIGGLRTLRNAPTLLGRGERDPQSWDGRAASLAEQVLLPIEDPREMALPLPEALARLGADPGYRARFAEVLGSAPDRAGLARALAAYVGGLRLGPGPLERFRAGEIDALSPEERGGMWIFESRGRCWRCHTGQDFSDESFHATGVGSGAAKPDTGRAAVTGDPADRGRFKTPTLRGLERTAPYMHDGSMAALEQVLEHYRTRAGGAPGLDPILSEIRLEPEDLPRLAAFLRALSRETR